ncbi:Glutamate-1-semialdehyde 2,1-aminomutase [Nitrosotalea sinensis]|uniref:Glutamate-1-semialdehyde 2,1-aminomutase n=1 Tax=Nitrosotalea sinensis TaxID=1499975 RepID=A0A2H1EJQ0_9ARCH|nr:glutamate-1-semialdehyde 2,1-aminomutase [Candidatus Nitrosotalea sinensis]SHO48091.1 Glutamate-1-semialdehyde 2,1-aminomutase [Candidatus Nitrosotalea sinensis]
MTSSKSLFMRAKKIIPSGINSPVRYYPPYPFFVKKAKGSMMWDVDGNKYLDFCNAYGALLLGHLHQEIISDVKKQIEKGTLYCAPTEIEIKLSELVSKNLPSMEKTRLVNTGSEATMTAIRLARGFTKKKKIIKFEGCYHGAHDYVLVKAGSGAAHIGISVSEGSIDEVSRNTLVVQYNNIKELQDVLEKEKDVAAVIVEPVLANMGLILPEKDFLQNIRKLTSENDSLLIFDEVVTGFRMSTGGAQKYFGIKPDITTLGKALGNGFPIAAVGGKSQILDMLSPEGNVYQASTYAGNPISVSAGISSIQTMNTLRSKLYPKLEKNCKKLVSAIGDLASDMKIPHQINSISSMFQIFFTDNPVVDYTSAKKSDMKTFKKLFETLLKNEVFIAPSQFETVFLSYAHSDEDLNKTISAYEKALRTIKS